MSGVAPGGVPIGEIEALTAEEMRQVDRLAAERWEMGSETLMEVAGRQVAWALASLATHGLPPRPAGRGLRRVEELPAPAPLPLRDPPRVAVVAGRGHNGGDGLVAARTLADWGFPVRVLALADEMERAEGLPGLQWRRLGGWPVERRTLGRAAEGIEEALRGSDWIVDAVTGSGVQGGLHGGAARAAEAMAGARARGARILAVDLPSGSDADRGACPEPSVHADVTVTIGRPKLGTLLFPAAEAAGLLLLGEIPVPPVVWRAAEPRAWLLEPAGAAALLPARPAAAHKGAFGHVLVVGGSRGLSGAPGLAARGAVRGGAGLVSVATVDEVAGPVAGSLPEAMVSGFRPDPDGRLGPEVVAGILALAERADVLLLGPGLGRSEGTRGLVRALLERWQGGLVLDADALAVVGADEVAALRGRLPRAAARTVVTPHPGEAARFLGRPTGEILTDLPAAARELARRAGAAAILKGAHTLVAAPDGRLWVNPTGNPGMATGGSGDVLGGLVAALVGQGLEAAAAARLAVYLHGLAGDLAAEAGSARALAAGDLADGLGAAYRWLEEGARSGRGPRRGSEATGHEMMSWWRM
ncbi:MAG: NAD(P)H-hydrate dehydratase [Bacillota bacterium]|nr:NAD(P)H-hydrate dehydratase [Bacillota bacterium]